MIGECSKEITNLTIWFSKNKYAPMLNTVLQKKGLGPDGKPRMFGMPCKIVKCADTLLCIAENSKEVKGMIPTAMKHLPNLNDLTRMDDFLHLLQYMIKHAEDPVTKQ